MPRHLTFRESVQGDYPPIEELTELYFNLQEWRYNKNLPPWSPKAFLGWYRRKHNLRDFHILLLSGVERQCRMHEARGTAVRVSEWPPAWRSKLPANKKAQPKT